MKRRRKRATTKKTKNKKFAVGEHVRVVPLHQPAVAAPPKVNLTYRGGALIPSVEVFTIFWGKLWRQSSPSKDTMRKLNKFFSDIVVSPLIDQLAEYDVPGQTIGHGSFIGTKMITQNAPAGSVTDSVIQAQLKKWISANTIVKNTANTLYFVFLDPGIVSILGGSRSCQSYCGYHNNVGAVYYAVMPYPSCSGCLGGLQTFDALTATSSHELCEAITDPVPGSGWYDDTNGEIGDICAWSFKQMLGYTVQLEWSNQQQKCV
jgi:hypothetical protein